jgi:hypothetical protein
VHDLLIVIKECAIADPVYGRRILRVGCMVNMTPEAARPYVQKGHMRLLSEAAPLFAQATDPPMKPKKRAKEPPTDGT